MSRRSVLHRQRRERGRGLVQRLDGACRYIYIYIYIYMYIYIYIYNIPLIITPLIKEKNLGEKKTVYYQFRRRHTYPPS